MTFSFVSSCGIALRFRERETQCSVRSPYEKFIWLYLLVAFLFALSVMKTSMRGLQWFLGVSTALVALILCRIPQPNKPRTGHYSMPMVPLLPCVGILSNFMLAAILDAKTWLILFIFVCCGLVMYFSFSMWNSNLEKANVMRGEEEQSIRSILIDSRKWSRADSINSNTQYKYIPPEFGNIQDQANIQNARPRR
jgi:hypothetical protein